MPFEYGTNINAIVQVLKDHNTTTATPYLSNSMTTVIDSLNIVIGDPEVSNMRPDRLPSIYVRVSRKEENFSGIGPVGATSARVKKEAMVTYDVIGFHPKQGAMETYGDLLSEIYVMARNIESVLNHEFSLSGTALWSQPAESDFFPPVEISGSWVKAVLIQLKAKYLYR